MIDRKDWLLVYGLLVKALEKIPDKEVTLTEDDMRAIMQAAGEQKPLVILTNAQDGPFAPKVWKARLRNAPRPSTGRKFDFS